MQVEIILDENLIPLPKRSSEFRDFVNDLVRDYGIAELTHKHGIESSLIFAGEADIEWVGDKRAPIYLGYPFIRSLEHHDDNGKVIKTDHYAVANIGAPLILLFESKEHHAWVFVRGDVYER